MAYQSSILTCIQGFCSRAAGALVFPSALGCLLLWFPPRFRRWRWFTLRLWVGCGAGFTSGLGVGAGLGTSGFGSVAVLPPGFALRQVFGGSRFTPQASGRLRCWFHFRFRHWSRSQLYPQASESVAVLVSLRV